MTRVKALKSFTADGYPQDETTMHGMRFNREGMICEVPTSRVEYLLSLGSIALLPPEEAPVEAPAAPSETVAAETVENSVSEVKKPRRADGRFALKNTRKKR
jgi:hypothetical protein